MFIFATLAAIQTDIKRILAYSTISNCAYIYYLFSNNLFKEAGYFFVVHGLFKSLTFFVAGAIIIANNHK